jgi:hypothetical protein
MPFMVRLLSIFAIVFFTNFISLYKVYAGEKQCDRTFNMLVLSLIDICPKPSELSDFKDPKIQVTTAWSTFIGNYLNTSDHLSNGQCMYYPSWPLSIRYCARIAQITPDVDPTKDPKKDPGYTKSEHINNDSITEKDEAAKYEQIIESDDNNTAKKKCLALQKHDPVFSTQSVDICNKCPDEPNEPNRPKKTCTISFDYYSTDPKLCLYRDPWLLDMMLFPGAAVLMYDPFDYNPIYQPFHAGTQSTFGTILIVFLDLGVGSLEGLLGLIPGVKNIIQFFGNLIKVFGESIVKALTMMNSKAYPIGSDGGCVNIPLGPNPPPYCKTLNCKNITMKPKLEKICPTTVSRVVKNDKGIITEQDLVTKTNYDIITQTIKNLDTDKPDLQKPTYTDSPAGLDNCVTSDNYTNNFVHNSVRISYSWPLDLCKYDVSEAPSGSTKERKLEQKQDNKKFDAGMCVRISPTREKIDENMMRYSGIIKACGNTGVDEGVCVHVSQGATLAQNKQYRINSKLDVVHSGATNNDNNISMILTGIDIGDFQDVAITNNSSPTTSLYDINNQGTTYTLTAYGDDGKFTTAPKNSICSYQGDKLLACVKRADPPQAQIYDCTTKLGKQSCISTSQNPTAIVGVEVGGDRLYDIISKKNKDNFNIFGLSIKFFVTDETFLYPPFDKDQKNVVPDKDDKAVQSVTIIGKYDPDISVSSISDQQLSKMPNIGDDYTYISGLEYYKGDYRYGGKYLCLDNSKYVSCPNNPQDCVLVKTKNSSCKKIATDQEKATTDSSPDLSQVCTASTSLDDRLWPQAPSVKDKESLNSLILKESDPENNQCYTPKAYQDMIQHMKDKNMSISIDNPCKLPIPEDITDIKQRIKSTEDIDERVNTKVAIRNKNSIEQGLCVELPQPEDCKAIDVATEDSSFATWNATKYGEQAKGVCASGYFGSPTRYCVVNVDDGQTHFGKITGTCSK